MPKPVSIIAACSLNRVIGKQGKLPWRLPCDWSFFCTATKDQVLILGRRSFEETNEPLPNRHTIVVSPSRASQKTMDLDVPVVASLADALHLANEDPRYASTSRIFVGGGERLYAEALSSGLIESCYITRVHSVIDDGDAFLPSWTAACPHLQFAATSHTNGTRYVGDSFALGTGY